MRRYTYNYSMERFEIDEEGYWCKWEDVEKLQVQFDIAQKEVSRASETFIHNFVLLKENRKYREALERIKEMYYVEGDTVAKARKAAIAAVLLGGYCIAICVTVTFSMAV